jgi:2-oxoglutarate ferredoxin oxidoreductase subunit beta
MLRRKVPFIYIVENNGVYGLTKGQFSATADEGSRLKDGSVNDLPAIDLCALAIELGATFVARAFSADRKQLLELLKAAVAHQGLAVLDVMSPCVTFNNHEGSTRSYDWGRDHETRIHEIGFVPAWDHPEIEGSEEEAITVRMPHGGEVRVRRVGVGHDPRNRNAALELLWQSRDPSEFLTGLFYLQPDDETLPDILRLTEAPLATLPEDVVRPSREALEQINASLS